MAAGTIGVNLAAQIPSRVLGHLYNALGEKDKGLGTNRPMFTKAGAPATDTAGDNPGEVFAWCYDTTNNDWYLCTAYTDSTHFTWVRIING